MSTSIKDHLPETNCKFMGGNRIVACAGYIQKDGNFNFHCCQKCGWNPFVAKQRIEKLVEERRWNYGAPRAT